MTRARETADLPVAMTESGGQVGVGTSPAAKLHVAASGNFNQTVRVEDTSVSGRRLDFSYNSTGPYIWVNNSEPLNIYTGGSTRFQIDASGRVTMPNQPSFMARRQGTTQTTGTVVFNQTVHNVGNHYSTTTGGFTAPIGGRYLFAVVGMAQDNYFRGQILKNGSGMTQFRTDHDGATGLNYAQATITVIFQLAANDIIKVTIDSGNFGGGTAEVQFFGQLLS